MGRLNTAVRRQLFGTIRSNLHQRKPTCTSSSLHPGRERKPLCRWLVMSRCGSILDRLLVLAGAELTNPAAPIEKLDVRAGERMLPHPQQFLEEIQYEAE